MPPKPFKNKNDFLDHCVVVLMREEAKKKIGARVIGTRKVLEAAY